MLATSVSLDGSARGRTPPHRPARSDKRHSAATLRKVLVAPASLLLAAATAGAAGLVGATAAGATTARATAAKGATTVAAFRATGSMLQPAAHATATLLRNGEVLVAGGADGGTPLANAELYDPGTGTWKSTGSLPLAVSEATATLLRNGEVLVAGGLTTTNGALAPTADAELYDPATGTWAATGSLPAASYDAGAALTGSGEVLYAGGLPSTASGALATTAAELYNPGTKSFTAAKPLPAAVAGAETVALANGTVLVAGGATGASGAASPLSEVFTPWNSSWVPVGHMLAPVTGATSTLLGGGNVLVAGGQSSASGAPTADTELYVSSTRQWISTGSLPVASSGATATVLRSGELLYAGGVTASGAPTASAALFNPWARTWAATSPLLVPSAYAVSARLDSGDALVASGLTSSGATGEGEVYSAQSVASTPQGKAPAITSAAAATVEVGHDIELTLRATGTPVPSFSESGGLPPGMAFRDNHDGTANIYGTPAATAAASYAVTVYASNGVSPAAAQRLVISVVRAPAITSAASAALVAGKWGSVTVSATGTPTPSLSESGALPPGMTFRDNHNGTATISGTLAITDGGNYPVSISASNGVSPAAAQRLVLSVTAVAKPALITSAAAVPLTAGKWAQFTVTSTGTPTPTLSESGALPPGLAFHANSNGTATISGTLATSDSGAYAVTVYATNRVGATAAQRLVMTVTPAVTNRPALITSAAATTLVAGQKASFTVTTSASPAATLSESGGLPPGLAFAASSDGTATISGTPAVSDNGVYVVTIYATNHLGATASQRLSLTVEHPAMITSTGAVSFTAGKAGAFTVSAAGTPMAHVSESGVLPPGLAFHANDNGTAAISGTPAATDNGTWDVTVYASNGIGATASQRLALSIVHAVVTHPALITSPSSFGIESGTSVAFNVVASGTPAPTLSISSGVLPPGLAFHNNGNGTATISGRTSALIGGTYTVTIVASNGVGSPASQRLSIAVARPEAASFDTPSSHVVQAGLATSITVASSGTPTPTLSESGALPAGLSFQPAGNGTARISGTPALSARGSYSITVVATNGVGSPAVQQLSITVAVPAAGVGYWYVTTSGQVLGQGAAKPIAPVAAQHPSDIVAMAVTPDQNGYYLVSSHGGVYVYGDAVWYGSVVHLHLTSPVVAIALTPSGHGYYLVTRAGNVFHFGDARWYGSPVHAHIPAVTAFAVDPAGTGYWVVTAKGNVYTYGSATWWGSATHRSTAPIVAFAPTSDGKGYWLVTSKGNVYQYGNAPFLGSMAHRRTPPIVGFGVDTSNSGYWLVTTKGNVYNFGKAGFFGSSAHTTLSRFVAGFAAEL